MSKSFVPSQSQNTDYFFDQSNNSSKYFLDNNTLASSNFFKAFYSFYYLPKNLLIEKNLILDNAKTIVELFKLFGYFEPLKLWQDIHLFGRSKNSKELFFKKPALVFASVYKICKQSGAYEDKKFDSEFFIKNLLNLSKNHLSIILDHNINLSKNQTNDNNILILKHLLLYWFQNSFNREVGQERLHLLSKEVTQHQDIRESKIAIIQNKFAELGFIKEVCPRNKSYDYIFITGSSFEGMQLIFDNIGKRVVPFLAGKQNFWIQTGDRDLGINDISLLYKGIESINYAKEAIQHVACHKGISLNFKQPFLEEFKEGKIVALTPNYASEQDACLGLKETDIAKYFVDDRYNQIFYNQSVHIVDTKREYGADRPNTYTAAIQTFLEIIAELIVNHNFKPDCYKVLVITTGSPFIQRQGIVEFKAFHDVMDNLLDIVSRKHFCTIEHLASAINFAISKNLSPSDTIKNIKLFNNQLLCFSSENSCSNQEIIEQLSCIKKQFIFEPVGSGIENLDYKHAISVIYSEFGANFLEHYLINEKEIKIDVMYQSRENDITLVPEFPSEQILAGYLAELEHTA